MRTSRETGSRTKPTKPSTPLVAADSTVNLRKSGGALILTVPAAYVKQNGLRAGAVLAMRIDGPKIALEPVKAPRRRPTLAELLANTREFARDPGWEEMAPVGNEFPD